MSSFQRQKRAIALGFELGKDSAPSVHATGQAEVAQDIIRAARRFGVPIHQETALVEELKTTPKEAAIPEQLYDRVAQILVHCCSSLQKPQTRK